MRSQPSRRAHRGRTGRSHVVDVKCRRETDATGQTGTHEHACRTPRRSIRPHRHRRADQRLLRPQAGSLRPRAARRVRHERPPRIVADRRASTRTTSSRPPRRSSTTATAQGIDGPLFLGRDTHGLSLPAERSAIEVLVANGVDVRVDSRDSWVPTPALSHAILAYNRGRDARRPGPRRRHRRHAHRTTRRATAASSTTRRTAARPTPTRPAGSPTARTSSSRRASRASRARRSRTSTATRSASTTSATRTCATSRTSSTSTRSAAPACASAPTRWAGRPSSTGS